MFCLNSRAFTALIIEIGDWLLYKRYRNSKARGKYSSQGVFVFLPDFSQWDWRAEFLYPVEYKHCCFQYLLTFYSFLLFLLFLDQLQHAKQNIQRKTNKRVSIRNVPPHT